MTKGNLFAGFNSWESCEPVEALKQVNLRLTTTSRAKTALGKTGLLIAKIA